MKIRLQSAMEYLMTYGWAILAIAIVMVSLYSLGIFNAGSLQPTATPGSCQVVRTAAQVSLAGQCNGLIPKYVAQFSQGYVASATKIRQLTNATIVWWGYVTSIKSGGAGIGMPNCQVYIQQSGSSSYVAKWDPCVCNGYASCSSYAQLTIPESQWAMVAFTVNTGNVINSYAYFPSNGTVVTNKNTVPASGVSIPSGSFYIGEYAIYTIYQGLVGSVSNVQLYNTTLDNTTIKSLYQEGIGGAPIDLQHLIGWWPLNGNANDYSGFNNNANSISILNTTWNANWQGTYGH
ncbi:MAG: hypothetical protein KGH69_03450 [Candidatus Micrarchaeota archaeon]|nr:hypothetical protein [Candidatus Micrarchaeota archaeon]